MVKHPGDTQLANSKLKGTEPAWIKMNDENSPENLIHIGGMKLGMNFVGSVQMVEQSQLVMTVMICQLDELVLTQRILIHQVFEICNPAGILPPITTQYKSELGSKLLEKATNTGDTKMP